MSENVFYHWNFTKEQVITILKCLEKRLRLRNISSEERKLMFDSYKSVYEFYNTILIDK